MISSSSSAVLLLLLAPGSPRFSVAGRLSHLAASRSLSKFFSSSTSTTDEQELQSRAPEPSLLARPRRSSLRLEVTNVKYGSIDEVLASHDPSNGAIELRPLDIFQRGLGAEFTFSVPVVPMNPLHSSSAKYCDIQTPETSSSRPTLSRTNSITDAVCRIAENPLAAPELPSAAVFGDRDEFEVMPHIEWPQRELFTIREMSRDGLSLSRSSVTASAAAAAHQPTHKQGQPQLQTSMTPSAFLAAQSLLKEDRKFRKKEGLGDVPLSSAVQRLAEQVKAEEERAKMAKKERRGSKSRLRFF